MKKTLIITLEYPPDIGGIATYVDDLAEAIGGDKVIVLAPENKEAEAHDSLRSHQIVRKRLLFPRFFWPRWLLALQKTLIITGKEPIGRVFAHHVLPIGYVAIMLKWFWKIPFVVFYHGADVHSGLNSWWKRKMIGFVAGQSDMNIFDSLYLRDKFIEMFPKKKYATMIIAPCPDPIFSMPQTEQAIDEVKDKYALRNKKIILSAGRLVEGKGFPHIIRLLPEIAKEIPNVVLVIAGDGPKMNFLAKKVQDMSIQHLVRIIGNVPRQELPALYQASDLFVLLTHPNEGVEEGFGLVFLEAAASGLPVVAGRSGGVPEAVIHEETGLIVNTYLNKEVVDACVRILKNIEESKHFADSARNRVNNDFQWSERVERLKPWIAL